MAIYSDDRCITCGNVRYLSIAGQMQGYVCILCKDVIKLSGKCQYKPSKWKPKEQVWGYTNKEYIVECEKCSSRSKQELFAHSAREAWNKRA